MIVPQTQWYRAALGRPHHPYTRTEVWRGARQLSDRVAIIDGSIRCTLNSRVTRVLTAVVSDELYPIEPSDLLSPYGHHLRSFRGVEYGDGTVDEFQTFTGPIASVVPVGDGRATVRAVDLAGEVARSGFRNPSVAQRGDLIVDEVQRLIDDAIANATFGTHSADLWQQVPELSYDFDRGAALDILARAVGGFWYALADGRFVLRRVPWAQAGAPVMEIRDGDGGTILRAFPQRDSETVDNVVTVSSERPDGGVPLTATVEDLDPTSPTFTGGVYGVKARQVRITGASNQGQVLDIAKTLLRSAKARTESWRVQHVADASIELGDVLALSYRGRTGIVQVVAGFDMSLSPTESMTLDLRGQIPGLIEEEVGG